MYAIKPINQFSYLQTHSSVTALLYNDVTIIYTVNVELKQHELIKLTKLKHKSSKTNILHIWKLLVMYYANAVIIYIIIVSYYERKTNLLHIRVSLSILCISVFIKVSLLTIFVNKLKLSCALELLKVHYNLIVLFTTCNVKDRICQTAAYQIKLNIILT